MWFTFHLQVTYREINGLTVCFKLVPNSIVNFPNNSVSLSSLPSPNNRCVLSQPPLCNSPYWLFVCCSIISNSSGPVTPRRKSNGHAAPVSPGSDELTDDYVSLKPIRPPPPLPNRVSPVRHPLARQSSKVVAAASRTYATLAAFQGKILILLFCLYNVPNCFLK